MFTPSGLVWGIVSVVAGILIIVWPGLIRWLLGLYLIIVGLIAIFWR